MKRIHIWLARARVRRLRRELDENERCRVALVRQLDYLLQLEREASVALAVLEEPMFYRPHERSRVYS